MQGKVVRKNLAKLEIYWYIGDGYGNRLQTYIMPPVTCDWNFYIASDDRSKLYLSSNDDPANKDLVASVNGWTQSKEWKKFVEAQKGTVSLVKGELYYLEAIHKEGGGGDNLAVGWECFEHDISLQVISAEFTTASFLPTASPTISPTIPQCADDSSCAGGVTNPCEKSKSSHPLSSYYIRANLVLILLTSLCRLIYSS